MFLPVFESLVSDGIACGFMFSESIVSDPPAVVDVLPAVTELDMLQLAEQVARRMSDHVPLAYVDSVSSNGFFICNTDEDTARRLIRALPYPLQVAWSQVHYGMPQTYVTL